MVLHGRLAQVAAALVHALLGEPEHPLRAVERALVRLDAAHVVQNPTWQKDN